jgi:vacuolar-type H+-ATPase subunit I/STV1
MPPQTIENKVQGLEKRVTTLEQLPERMTAVESQIVQLRSEMRDGFSAVRQEIRDGDEETRRYMRVLIEDVIGRIATIQEGLTPKRKQGRK